MRKKITDDTTLADKLNVEEWSGIGIPGMDPPSDDEPTPPEPISFDEAGRDRTIFAPTQLCKQWVWVTSIKRFIRRSDGVEWDREMFDSHFGHLASTASIARELFRDRQQLLHKFDYKIWKPNEAEFGANWYNTWKPSLIVPKQGDTSLWDYHMQFLLPNESDRDMVLDWLAWVYQHPNELPGKVLLIVGKIRGTGKSFVFRVFEHLIGNANTQRPANASLSGQFNAWVAQCKLAIFEELKQVGNRETVNKLLDLITEPRIEVNIKFKTPILVENYTAIGATSNFPDALPIDDGDRRWQVAECPVTQAKKDAAKADGHFRRIMAIVGVDGRPPDNDALAAIAYQLQTRDVRNFEVGTAQMTTAKAEMIEHGRKSFDRWLIDNRESDPFTRDLVNIESDIMPLVPDYVMRDHTTRNPASMVLTFLKDKCEGVAIGSHRNGKGRQSKVVSMWAINDLGAEIKSKMRKRDCEARAVVKDLDVTGHYMAQKPEAAEARFQQAVTDFREPYDEGDQ